MALKDLANPGGIIAILFRRTMPFGAPAGDAAS
jgi:hypothetical protein